MQDQAVIIRQVSKSYGNTRALRDISFQVGKGELFGLIGPDGAGKTSLFRILTTLLLPDQGSVTIEGYDVVKQYRKIRNLAGYMPGRFSLYQDLSVEENLKFFATIFGTTIKENYHLIRDIYVQIEPFKDRLAGKLSGGMKQKLALCCCLVHKPAILVLDEPTTGVDAISRKEFWEMLGRLKAEGITILVSTPYMDEASLCDRIALIEKGSIMAIDRPENISGSFSKPIWAVRSREMYPLLIDLRQYPGVEKVYLFGQYIHLTLGNEGQEPGRMKKFLEDKGHEEVEIKVITPGIEDSFIELMSQQKRHE
ncbi:MAG: ABC transporter ATP-binding protein [Bacteroidetes bacterium]|nr:ABC transporter ATP-binding protein [Bacteroidota bacterium]